MLRKLNFTDRVKIPRGNIRVALRRDPDGVLAFDPQLSFDGVAATPGARVFIEAYYRTAFMRFDCGSVEDFAPPADRRLTEIDGTNLVRFRVKLVDNRSNEHRIVAVADGIAVSADTPEACGRLSLLPVNFSDDLDQQAWRIEFEPEGPVLELNNGIPSVREVAKSDAAFFALVYPAAIREVLSRILIVDGQEAHQEGDDWWNLWLRWAARYAAPLPRSIEEAAPWIEEVVEAFCKQQRAIERWRATEAQA